MQTTTIQSKGCQDELPRGRLRTRILRVQQMWPQQRYENLGCVVMPLRDKGECVKRCMDRYCRILEND